MKASTKREFKRTGKLILKGLIKRLPLYFAALIIGLGFNESSGLLIGLGVVNLVDYLEYYRKK